MSVVTLLPRVGEPLECLDPERLVATVANDPDPPNVPPGDLVTMFQGPGLLRSNLRVQAGLEPLPSS